jgi:hypothetical protein
MTEDLAPFFSDFALPCTVNGQARLGIFDSGTRLGSIASAGMASAQPMLTVATDGIAADPVGQPVVVNSTNYVVAAHDADGTGISTLMLERA